MVIKKFQLLILVFFCFFHTVASASEIVTYVTNKTSHDIEFSWCWSGCLSHIMVYSGKTIKLRKINMHKNMVIGIDRARWFGGWWPGKSGYATRINYTLGDTTSLSEMRWTFIEINPYKNLPKVEASIR